MRNMLFPPVFWLSTNTIISHSYKKINYHASKNCTTPRTPLRKYTATLAQDIQMTQRPYPGQAHKHEKAMEHNTLPYPAPA
jgi:pyruvate/2-oxoacid:ferredoxin oxidoreductase alpha subunit